MPNNHTRTEVRQIQAALHRVEQFPDEHESGRVVFRVSVGDGDLQGSVDVTVKTEVAPRTALLVEAIARHLNLGGTLAEVQTIAKCLDALPDAGWTELTHIETRKGGFYDHLLQVTTADSPYAALRYVEGDTSFIEWLTPLDIEARQLSYTVQPPQSEIEALTVTDAGEDED